MFRRLIEQVRADGHQRACQLTSSRSRDDHEDGGPTIQFACSGSPLHPSISQLHPVYAIKAVQFDRRLMTRAKFTAVPATCELMVRALISADALWATERPHLRERSPQLNHSWSDRPD